MQTLPRLLAIVTLLTAPLPQAPLVRPTLPSEDQVAIPAEGVTVPMLDIGGRPAVALTINGTGPYTFILDTGASISVIDPKLIEQLGLPSANGTAGTGPVRITALGLNGITIREMTAGRSPGLLAAVSPTPPRGVLSAMAFPGALVSFDFPARQVHIRKGSLGDADGRRIFAYADTDRLPVVPVHLDGRAYHIHLDTGAPLTISLPTARARDLGLADRLVETGRVRVAAGEFSRYEAPFSGTATLGDFRLDLGTVGFSDMRAGPEPGKGVIGMALLREFVVTLDAKSRRILFERPAR